MFGEINIDSEETYSARQCPLLLAPQHSMSRTFKVGFLKAILVNLGGNRRRSSLAAKVHPPCRDS